MKHTRWFCYACEREWLWAHGWDESKGCPACQSPDIQRRTYKPDLPGLDIPRNETPYQAIEPVDSSRVERQDSSLLTMKKNDLSAMPELQ